MAHYSSNSQLWTDEHFLKLGRLERLLVLYLIHGTSRCNLPGLVADSALNIADRLLENVNDVTAALVRMCEDPTILQMDSERRLLRSPLAARMDPHRGVKSLQSWHKNWQHLPESELKYHHLSTLRDKVDTTNVEQVRVWNATFGAEANGRYALAGSKLPAQLRLPEQPPEPAPKQQQRKRTPPPPSDEETMLPGRDSVEHMNAASYVARFSPHLLEAGTVSEMGASVEHFASAMDALKRKCSAYKRAKEWDETAVNFIETELFIRGLHHTNNSNGTRGTHAHDRGGRPGPRKTPRTRERGDVQNDSAGQWTEILSRKAAEPSAYPDT